jgi:hypothetical protein
MVSVAALSDVLHGLFTTTADRLAAETGFVRRKRLWPGSAFAQALTFGWLDRPDASLERLAAHAGSSRQALDQRLTPTAVSFLAALLSHALELALTARPAAVPLLRRFHGVYVEDCTTVSLPDSCALDFPGCGGSTPADGRAAVKIYLRYELLGGAIPEVDFQPGRQPDVTAGQKHSALPAGALRLADLGFFDLGLLKGYSDQGVHWVSRLPAHASVAPQGEKPVGIATLLARQRGDRIDQAVRVGEAGELACRLLACRCPPDVTKRRRERAEATARKKGRPVSARQRELAGWTVLVTDLPADRLSFAEAWELYRARWQVELLFKRLKSTGGLAATAGAKKGRALCEVLAKLLGQVVANWAALLRGGPLAGFSSAKAARVVQQRAGLLRGVVAVPDLLGKVLAQLVEELGRLRPGKRRRPTTRDRLLNPSLCWSLS